MIELGALLGAIALAHSVFVTSDGRDGGEIVLGMLIAPALGALWGAGVAAVIHYTANGALLDLLLGLFGLLFGPDPFA